MRYESPLDNDEKLAAFRRVGDYPIYVAAGFSIRDVRIAWWRRDVSIAAIELIPCIAVWTLIGFSLRRLKAEEATWQSWRGELALRRSAEASTRRMQRMGTLGNLVANVHDHRQAVVKRLIEMLNEAKSRSPKFVVFPELALTTFFPRYWMSAEAAIKRFFERTMLNPDVQPLFDAAHQAGIGFYLGYAELTSKGEAFNTAIIVDDNGKIVAKYRKTHLPRHSDHKPNAPFQHLEKKFFEVGNTGFSVVETMGAKLGMCICNDRRWPETWRAMSLQGAELGVLGYNTPSLNIHWPEQVHLRMHTHLVTLQASAYQNAMWIAAAAKCGKEDGFHMIGGSVIVAPSGEIAAQSMTKEDEVIFANVDLALGDTFREHVFNFAKHRHPEHYGLIVELTGAGAPLPHDPDALN